MRPLSPRRGRLSPTALRGQNQKHESKNRWMRGRGEILFMICFM